MLSQAPSFKGLESLNESPYAAFDFANRHKAFEPVARLCGLAGTKGDSKSVKVLRGADSATDAITLNGSMKDNAKRAVNTESRGNTSYGSVEGIVDVLTLRKPPGIRLSEIATGDNVVCIIDGRCPERRGGKPLCPSASRWKGWLPTTEGYPRWKSDY